MISNLAHDVGLCVVFDDIAEARAHAQQIAKIAATRPAYWAGGRIQVPNENGVTVLEMSVAAG